MCIKAGFGIQDSCRRGIPRTTKEHCSKLLREGFRIRDAGFRIHDVERSVNRGFAESSFLLFQRGASLVELIMFIVIVSAALAGILLVMNQVTRGSADPLLRKQAIAAAYSLLEEIELQDFISASGVTAAVTQANRASAYHIVSDYNGFATGGIFTVTDAAAASAVLANYNASVAVTPAALSDAAGLFPIAAASAVQIDVTVTGPNGETVTATGYRAGY